jgi:hypothetical protein
MTIKNRFRPARWGALLGALGLMTWAAHSAAFDIDDFSTGILPFPGVFAAFGRPARHRARRAGRCSAARANRRPEAHRQRHAT